MIIVPNMDCKGNAFFFKSLKFVYTIIMSISDNWLNTEYIKKLSETITLSPL